MVGFAGGLAQGLQGLPDEVGGILDAIRQRKASEALAKWAASQGQQPPQAGGSPPPSAPPTGAPHPAAALAALGGGGAPSAPSSAPPPTAGPPQAQPAGPPPPDPNLSATAQPGQQFADPMQEAQQTLGALIRSVKAANPKIDPRTLMSAVHTQLDEMKGILPTTKAVMQGQVQLLKSQMDMQFRYTKLNAENENFAEKLQELGKRHAEQADFDKAREEHLKRLDAISEERTEDYGRNVDNQHTDRQATDSTRRYVADSTNQTRRDTNAATNQTRENVSGDRSDDSTYRADQSYRGAQVRSGQNADPAPKAGAGRRGPATVKGPDDIRKLPSGTKWVSADGKRRGVAP